MSFKVFGRPRSVQCDIDLTKNNTNTKKAKYTMEVRNPYYEQLKAPWPEPQAEHDSSMNLEDQQFESWLAKNKPEALKLMKDLKGEYNQSNGSS